MIPNDINQLTKSYQQSGTTFGNVIKEIKLKGLHINNIDDENVNIHVKYQASIFEDVDGVKGDLLQSTANFKPIVDGDQYAVNTTIVNALTGVPIGEFNSRNSNQIRDIQTGEIIGTVNVQTKEYTPSNEDNFIETSAVTTTITIEGETNFLGNGVLSGAITLPEAVYNAFDLLINTGRV